MYFIKKQELYVLYNARGVYFDLKVYITTYYYKQSKQQHHIRIYIYILCHTPAMPSGIIAESKIISIKCAN